MPTNPQDPKNEPGRTAGKAEGEHDAAPEAGLEAGEPGTPSQAEGERETVEANLEPSPPPRR